MKKHCISHASFQSRLRSDFFLSDFLIFFFGWIFKKKFLTFFTLKFSGIVEVVIESAAYFLKPKPMMVLLQYS